ncbi:MAG: tyrosine-type recombinase/integrase [Bacteroidales bacterium]|nr:tyrosine-type recombinase/integrase [Bacteroidales bacterium]
MQLINAYIKYIKEIRRYSPRTVSIYEAALKNYASARSEGEGFLSDDELVKAMNASEIRSYEVELMDSDPPKSPRTVALHLSALSSFCHFLMKEGRLKSNPVKLVPKPKQEKRIPKFFRKEDLETYFKNSSLYLDKDLYEVFLKEWHTKSGKDHYSGMLERMIVSTLYSLGIRRAELIGLQVGSFDFGRNVVKIHGKGDKMREIPLVPLLSEEILLYLKAVEVMCGRPRSLEEPLFVTYQGTPLYPEYVDRAVKSALRGVKDIRGRKSPHVLRHSLATELMNEDADLNSIKELLGHSSLAATQVYTHSSIARLKDIYKRAHPRAKNGGKHGD